MKKISINEHKKIMLKMLDEFNSFCNKNNILVYDYKIL